MLAELKWDSLTDRRRKHKLIAVYKMNYSQQQPRYKLRTANKIPPIKTRT